MLLFKSRNSVHGAVHARRCHLASFVRKAICSFCMSPAAWHLKNMHCRSNELRFTCTMAHSRDVSVPEHHTMSYIIPVILCSVRVDMVPAYALEARAR
jgi:hypothetical protein